MLKPPRFMKEYAAYQIKTIEKLMRQYPNQETAYKNGIETINRALNLYTRGFIIIDEAMRFIADPFQDGTFIY